MGPVTNWLTFSLSPMEMLRSSSSSESEFVSYDAPAAAPYYLVDNFYANGWPNQKPQEFFVKEAQVTASMADSTILTGFIDPQSQTLTHNATPKLEDFLGDSSPIVRYSDSQTDTQDSSLTQIYDPHHHHQNQSSLYLNDHQDLKAIAGFQAFSTNSGSEVDDSAAISRTQFVGHSVESTRGELGFSRNALSLAVNNTNSNFSSGNNVNYGISKQSSGHDSSNADNDKKAIVAAADSDSAKKIADTFGQRTSIYRGVTRHRWTGRYEAHLWDNSCRREGQARKGRQVYLGGYDKEDKAARAYDLAALKYWGPSATTNFPVSNYSRELEEMKHMTKQEFIASLRRRSSGFSRGASIYRGVTRHHQQGRWQARIGRVAGNKDLYLGTFATEEEAAEAYDIAAIKFRGVNAVTNFEMSRYDVEAIVKSALPIGGAAKRLKLSLEPEQKPIVGQDDRSRCTNANHISFGSVPPLPCGVPFDTSALYHHNLFHHFPAAPSDSSGSATATLLPPQPSEFFLWPHQSY